MLLSSGKDRQMCRIDRNHLTISQHVAVAKKGWAGSSVFFLDGFVECCLGIYTV